MILILDRKKCLGKAGLGKLRLKKKDRILRVETGARETFLDEGTFESRFNDAHMSNGADNRLY